MQRRYNKTAIQEKDEAKKNIKQAKINMGEDKVVLLFFHKITYNFR